jgi:hypothetical protein
MGFWRWITERLKNPRMTMNTPITEKKNPSGLPHIEAIKVPLSSHTNWQREAARAAEVANDFMFDCYEETHPPRVVLSCNDLYVPKYAVIADTLIRVMVWHAPCNSAMTMLVCKAMEQIEGFDPWAVALEAAEERCQNASAS